MRKLITIFYLLLVVNYCYSIEHRPWTGNSYNCYDRGGGVVPSTCTSDREVQNSLCYVICKSGFSGFGPYCWENCKSDYIDHGVSCYRSSDVYGKDCCCIAGYCCGNCKSGYRDDGCTCFRDVSTYTKQSYHRGDGIPMICKSDTERDGALCYSLCALGYSGKVTQCCGNPSGYPGYTCLSERLSYNTTRYYCKDGVICLPNRICECPQYFSEQDGKCIIKEKCSRAKHSYGSCIELLCKNANSDVWYADDAIRECVYSACIGQDFESCLGKYYDN